MLFGHTWRFTHMRHPWVFFANKFVAVLTSISLFPVFEQVAATSKRWWRNDWHGLFDIHSRHKVMSSSWEAFLQGFWQFFCILIFFKTVRNFWFHEIDSQIFNEHSSSGQLIPKKRRCSFSEWVFCIKTNALQVAE